MPTVDLCVYGPTLSGIAAAIVAARAGRTVAIICPEETLGGMLTGGLGITDAPQSFKNWAGGVVDEFTSGLTARTGFTFPLHQWCFAASAAQAVIDAMIAAETRISVHLGETLIATEQRQVPYVEGMLASRLSSRGTALAAIVTNTDTYRAQVFIDASYDGALMQLAGVPNMIGREDFDLAREPYAGNLAAAGHTTTRTYDVVDARGNLTKYGGWRPTEASGQADRRSMALGFRNMVTNVQGANNLGFPAPPGYDRNDFLDDIARAQRSTLGFFDREVGYEPMYRVTYDATLAAQHITGFAGLSQKDREARWLRSDFAATDLPEPQRLVNMMAVPGKFSTNGSDIRGPLAWEYSTASEARRQEIKARLAYRELGRLHTLQNDPDVPQATRTNFAPWGLCADEWQDVYTLRPGWPHEVYQRHGRRLIGQAMMDMWSNAYQTNWPDQIAVGSYFMDSKAKSQFATPYGGTAFEGHYAVQPFADADGTVIRADLYKIFGVPQRAVVPPRGVCDNLIVSWGISSTEVAFSAIRLEPFLSAVGEACGHLAVASMAAGVDPALIDHAPVRARLEAAGLTIHRFSPVI